MRLEETGRGFEIVLHDDYAGNGSESRLVQQSSAILDYEDSLGHPGSSALWVGKDHHLNREEVEHLVERLSRWLETGSLALEGDQT